MAARRTSIHETLGGFEKPQIRRHLHEAAGEPSMNTMTRWLLAAAVVMGAVLGAASRLEAAERVSLENLVPPEPNRADEPLAKQFSLERALHFLDSASLDWQQS